jgi:hypothetical protein
MDLSTSHDLDVVVAGIELLTASATAVFEVLDECFDNAY